MGTAQFGKTEVLQCSFLLVFFGLWVTLKDLTETLKHWNTVKNRPEILYSEYLFTALYLI